MFQAVRRPDVHVRTAIVPDGGVSLAGARVDGDDLVRFPDGAVTYVLNAPATRRWGQYGDLADARPVGWSLEAGSDGAVLKAAEAGAEVDLLELTGDAASAFLTDAPEPMTIVPLFEPIGGVRELGQYLTGGRVLTGTASIKKPIDSTSLALYRTARLRGGPMWLGVAAHVAEVTAARVEQVPALTHDMWSAGETHVRFVNDALLLLVAHAEHTGEQRFRVAATRVCGLLDELSVDLPEGRWVLHDSRERDADRNDFVLNTHVQAIIALMAAGRDVRAELAALETALTPRVTGFAGIGAAGAIAAAETVRARGPRRTVRRRIPTAYARAARAAYHARALRFPGGWIARDLSGRRAPGRYLTVNLGDLAALAGSMRSPPPLLARSMARGVRFALRGGFFRAEVRDATPMSALIPAILQSVGEHDRAAAAAADCREAGIAPLPGWPGYPGRLWSRLGSGEPL